MNTRQLDPRRIPNRFRLQTLIEEDIILTLLEVGRWEKVLEYASLLLTREHSKTVDQQDNEAMATAYYALATRERELNQVEAAYKNYAEARKLNPSPWLSSNLFRNVGLVYLKEKKFAEAAKEFHQGVAFTEQHPELRGALPALYNYWGLALTRAALQAKQDPSEGLKIFEQTTQLYRTIFTEMQVSETEQARSHDWQSHQFHRGMVLCEITEQMINDKSVETQVIEKNLRSAEKLLLGSLEGRIVNKADGQRLGDVCVWLGRVYTGLHLFDNARTYLLRARGYFHTFFKEDDTVSQTKDVDARLAALPIAINSSPLQLHSAFATEKVNPITMDMSVTSNKTSPAP